MSENKMPEFEEEILLDFELIIGDAGGVIDNGDVPIRWCVSPDFVKKLEDKGVVDPHVLITSYAPKSIYNCEDPVYVHEMDRRLVPLAEMMTYLRFTRAGVAKVYGILLDGACGRGELNRKYLRLRNGSYDAVVDRYSDTLYEDIDHSIARTSNLVDIPTNVFGKEPSPWVKWYVNLWHDSRSKVTDECDYRKRKLIAFIFKWELWIPFILTVITYRALFAGTIALAGYFKKVKFLRVFRPYKYPSMEYNIFDSPISVVDDNIFIFKRKNLCKIGSDKTGMLFGLAFSPLIYMVMLGLVAGVFNPDGIGGLFTIAGAIVLGIMGVLFTIDLFVLFIEGMIRLNIGERMVSRIESIVDWIRARTPNIEIDMGNVFLVIAGIVLLVAVGFAFKYILLFLGMVGVATVIIGVFFAITVVFADKLSIWLDNYFALKAKDNDYSHLTELLCAKDEDNLRPNYNYIPKKQRTVRLWYHDLKNKVCKPMQD